MTRKVRKVLIVGGGTAGWMAAAAIGKHHGGRLDVHVVESEDIGTVGVGEATIPPIMDYNRSMGIDEVEFIRNTQATFKLGIEFVDWTRLGHTYFHPFGKYGVQMHGIHFYSFLQRHWQAGGTRSADDFCMATVAARAGRFRFAPANPAPVPPHTYAYHFDAGLYAAYLRKLAEARGVVRHEGKIVEVKQREPDGFIESVKLTDGRVLEADFFIDCSGFRGLLIEQTLKAGYEDWSEWLPCNRAMAVPCRRVEATTPFTRSTAREAGWQWRIPLQHRTGNGYVFCSEYMSEDEAASLLLTRLDGEALATPKPLRFVTGRRKETWKKNCVALGLAGGFLEPLESTSIHLIQTAIARLLFLFPGDNFDQAAIDKYNRMSRLEYEDVRDFLVLHYTAIERDDTPFWRHCRAIRKPDTLEQKWQMYESNGHILTLPGELFQDASWFAVLQGQGVQARAHHPFADIPDDAELDRRFDLIARDIRAIVEKFPTHDEFIRATCAAPPVEVKKMA
ncbi:MAG TPA: tryptophan halogenase family protein [Steroidobacteraceae bacterium]|nr:tryptophan halogenase family protein [Steroidobacteraceae bacterium]